MEITNINSSPSTLPHELVSVLSLLPDNGKDWKVGMEAGEKTDKTLMLIPKDKTMESSLEMIVISEKTQANTSVEELFQEIATMIKQFPGSELHILEDGKNRIVFETQATLDGKKAYNLASISKRGDQCMLLRYATKDAKDTGQLKAKYLPILEQVEIK